jgi:adenine/guanine phosphoribosyltransferase-like PRPP-binding protein
MIYHARPGENDHHHLEDLPLVVRAAVRKLKPHRDRFDCIIATGMSGVTVAAPVCVSLGVPLVVVRKKDDDSHHGERVVGKKTLRDSRALWLDDFVASGDTQWQVTQQAEKHGAKVVGSYLYADGAWNAKTWGARAALTFTPEAARA